MNLELVKLVVVAAVVTAPLALAGNWWLFRNEPRPMSRKELRRRLRGSP